MFLSEVFERFVEESPVSVMFRGTVERVLSPAKMDAIFAQHAVRQKVGELAFSACVDLMALMIAIPPQHWTEAFAELSCSDFARVLLQLAQRTNLRAFLTNPLSPKKPPGARVSGHRGNHVSTFKILQSRHTT